MRSSGKSIGLGMIAAGAILGIAGGAWLISGINEDKLEQSGAIFGLILLLGVVVLPLVGGGIFFVRKGAQEEKQMSENQRTTPFAGYSLYSGPGLHRRSGARTEVES